MGECAHLPFRAREVFHEFLRCRRCERIYWKGSHYERMQRFIAEVLSASEAASA